ncbi:serine/threonine kinase [Nocardiopsis sp. CC223A]|uniref:serine/threonine kinase n=1 Tax=Nocardiopsis sp. CC223A TaxID=3044051 RepID=UPI00278BE0A9|nr:serine/threonine kinase [Nocardiopsis sp. CC223A]
MAGFLFLIFLGALLGPPPETEPVAAAPSPSPSASPTPADPDVIGLALPDAEDELGDADFTLGEVVLATAEDGSAWNRSAMLVCFQRADGTVVDLSVVPEGTDCPDDTAAVQEWPALTDFVGGTVSEVQEWSEDAGISGVDVRSAFGDVDDPDADEAADHLVCAQSPDEATAPYRDSMVVKVHVVGPDEECPEEIGDPSPEPEPEPEPEPAPAPQPEPEPEPAPQPEPEPEPEAPSHVQGVHPGAFCSEHWQFGYTSAGTLMQCTTTATDSRFRWRQA